MIPQVKFAVLTSLLLAAHGVAALGATVVLREQSSHRAGMVYLGDIADITADTSAMVDDLKTTALLPAPAPGTHQYLSRTVIRDFLSARGVDVSQINFRGAELVVLGEAKPLPTGESQSNKSTPTQAELEADLSEAIIQNLIDLTAHEQWRVETRLDAQNYLRVAGLGAYLQVEGGRRPYSGRQYFRVSGRSGRESLRITAQVTKIQEVITPIRNIPKGEFVRAADLKTELVEGNISGNLATEPGQIIGMQTRRSIPTGKPILVSYLAAPLQVERGEQVQVFARTAGISVRTFAVAKQEGALGDLIQVETLDKKDRFMARVTGRRELEVMASGATVADYATLPRHDVYRR